MLIPVILSGGSGTRLWPLSRELYPKQLISLAGEGTLLQQTAIRSIGLPDADNPVILCNEHHRFMTAEQMRVIGVEPKAIFLEPAARSTAPALAVAALFAAKDDGDAVLLAMPADHIVRDAEAFSVAVELGARAAGQGAMVLFGVKPTGPETGYGYIRKGREVPDRDGSWFKVEAFVEKPDAVSASNYAQDPDYFFNCGMFMFKASTYIKELERFNPQIIDCCARALESSEKDMDFIRLDAESFKACPEDSIDYAVMEKTDNAVVVPLGSVWSDVGSWNSLISESETDDHGNALAGDVVIQDVADSYIRSENRLVAAVGVRDHIIIETKDAVLVADKNRDQEVKELVARLKKMGRSEAVSHSRVYRPWGCYETLDMAGRFQVKRITVKPGGVLSLQMHHHRAEHWVVVRGTAKIVKGEKEKILHEDQSTYIPLGTVHRLENPGRINLELIEVQTGSYLGEDDIVRLEDVYNRDK